MWRRRNPEIYTHKDLPFFFTVTLSNRSAALHPSDLCVVCFRRNGYSDTRTGHDTAGWMSVKESTSLFCFFPLSLILRITGVRLQWWYGADFSLLTGDCYHNIVDFDLFLLFCRDIGSYYGKICFVYLIIVSWHAKTQLWIHQKPLPLKKWLIQHFQRLRWWFEGRVFIYTSLCGNWC